LLLIGVTLSTLWKRLEERKPSFNLKIDEQCKEYLWSSVVSRHDELSFFQLETARPAVSTVKTRHITDPDSSVAVITEEQQNVSYIIITN